MKRRDLTPHNQEEWLSKHSQDKRCGSVLKKLLEWDLPADKAVGSQSLSISHLRQVQDVLSLLDVDAETFSAACIHYGESQGIPCPPEIEQQLTVEAKALIAELKKLSLFQEQKMEEVLAESAEGLRELLLALVQDIRVVLIVLADQLVSLRALAKSDDESKVHVARTCSQVYAPLANRLGIWQIKWELEDLFFRTLQEDTYKQVAKMLAEKRLDREGYIQEIKQDLTTSLNQSNIQAEISGRPKHIYSIWKKMQLKGLDFEQLFDIRALRILVETVSDCYTVLGMVHSKWQPVPGEFDDYIAMPKGNNYQSLHTAVAGPGGRIFEIQIRTFEMHDHAERGVAAHWRYKEGGKEDHNLSKKINWMRNLLENRDSPNDLIADFESEVAEDRIYVLTPKNKVIDLAAGSTVLDFAYHIHTEIGHRCIGAKVNQRIVPLTTQLITGQHVKILTRKEPRPSRDWLVPSLGFLFSSKSRAKVRQWFKREDRSDNLKAGMDILARECKQVHFPLDQIAKILPRFNFNSDDELAVALGQGDVTLGQLARAMDEHLNPRDAAILTPSPRRLPTKTQKQEGVSIQGVGNLMTSIAKCCNPVPGDLVIGFITRGRGVAVHRSDCKNLNQFKSDQDPRLVEIEWGDQANSYEVDLKVEAFDRKGLLKDLSTTLSNLHVQVINIQNETNAALGETHYKFRLSVESLEQLSTIHSKLAAIPNVFSVERHS